MIFYLFAGNRQVSMSVTNKKSFKNLTITPYHPDYILPHFILLDANCSNSFEVIFRSCDFCQIPKPDIKYSTENPTNM